MSDQGFKHITVTAPDEDDFIIQAGIVDKGEPRIEKPPIEEPAREPIGKPASEPLDEPVEKPVQQQESQIRIEQPTQPTNETAEAETKPAQRKAPEKADTYRQTTLEDLDTGPMPLAQRIVIIAAIVCIIGAVIYYFAFMR